MASVPLIFIVIRLAGDRRIVKGYPTSPIHAVKGWMTFVFMAAAVLLMIAGLLKILK